MKLQNLFFTTSAVYSHRNTRIQEDCGQCDMLEVVPEMYTPNPTYGDSAVGAICSELARINGKEYNIPDCMPWGIFDGKIIFRLGSYEYTRSRAAQACQVTHFS